MSKFRMVALVARLQDLVLNFRTAYRTDSGVLEERPRKIAVNYLTGWFSFDLLSCLPFQYLASDGTVTTTHCHCASQLSAPRAPSYRTVVKILAGI
jgi:hypothetical protein